MVWKSDAPAAAPAHTPQVQEPVLSKESKTRPAKNPGRVPAGKKLPERNRLAREAKKNQRPPDTPADEKKEPENPSGGVNGYLLYWRRRPGCLRTARLLTEGPGTQRASSSETQGLLVGPREKARRKFSSTGGKAPGYRLSPDNLISKRSSECWLLIGHKNCFVLLCLSISKCCLPTN